MYFIISATVSNILYSALDDRTYARNVVLSHLLEVSSTKVVKVRKLDDTSSNIVLSILLSSEKLYVIVVICKELKILVSVKRSNNQ